MLGLKPHRLYGVSNWLGSETPSNYLSLTPSLPHSLPLYCGFQLDAIHRENPSPNLSHQEGRGFKSFDELCIL